MLKSKAFVKRNRKGQVVKVCTCLQDLHCLLRLTIP
jgi:hypothetical protein